MKNVKEFDFDKKRPNFQKNSIKDIPEMKKEKTEDLTSLFNQPPLIKGLEIYQGNIIKKAKKNNQKQKNDELKTQIENEKENNLEIKENEIKK